MDLICNMLYCAYMKLDRLFIRLTPKEKNRIKTLALIYCNGNVSEYVVFAALNFERQFIKKKALPLKKSKA
jgi:hypothetical protein